MGFELVRHYDAGCADRDTSRLTFSMYLANPIVVTTPVAKTMAKAARLSSGELVGYIRIPSLRCSCFVDVVMSLYCRVATNTVAYDVAIVRSVK